MRWATYLWRKDEVTKICEAEAKRLFPSEKFKVEMIIAEPGRTIDKDYCIVDFRVRELVFDEAQCDYNCEGLAWGREEGYYEKCVEECRKNMEQANRGSIQFNPHNMKIIDSTLPIDCSRVIPTDLDEWDIYESPLEKSLEKSGCNVGWEALHVHHFIPDMPHDPLEIHEDYPVACYIHPTGCKVDTALKIVYGEK